MYLIPALRDATERADQLDELNRLNQAALTSIRLLQDKLGALADVRDEQVSEVCDIDTFCASLLKRLEKEEQELFGLARNAIAGETWFSIANQLMMHDKHLDEMKRSGLPPAERRRSARRRAAGRRGGRQPDFDSRPASAAVVKLDDAPRSRCPRPRAQSRDDAFMK
jgi:hypothetical protein